MNERDEHGWRIPRQGTRSRLIYARMCGGFTAREIHEEIGGSYGAIRVLMHKIKHSPDCCLPMGRPRASERVVPITLPQLKCLQ